MKNLILIGIVTIITMIACGDQTVIDPVLSKKYLVEIKIPPNSNIEWVMRQDSSYILVLPVDTTNDNIADDKILVTQEAISNASLSRYIIYCFYNRNKTNTINNCVLEKRQSGTYLLRMVNQK